MPPFTQDTVYAKKSELRRKNAKRAMMLREKRIQCKPTSSGLALSPMMQRRARLLSLSPLAIPKIKSEKEIEMEFAAGKKMMVEAKRRRMEACAAGGSLWDL